jgi:hypothetical protein
MLTAGVQAADAPATAPAAAATEPPAPAAAATDQAEPEAPPPPAPIPSDLSRLVEALPEEHRVLDAGGASFDIFVRTMTGGPAKGAIVLIPGDGGLPTTSEGLVELRSQLPAHGWSTWLLSLERPPRVQSLTAVLPVTPPDDEKAAAAGSPPAEGGEPPADPASTPPAPAKPQEADFPEDAAQPSLDARITAQMQDWITASQPRIAAAVAEAGKDGPVVVVAEGTAAPLLSAFVASGSAGIAGVVLLDPVELPGAPALWPEDFGTPVLEVLDAAQRSATGSERRTRANAAKLKSYQQITLPGGYGAEEGQPSVLVKRMRGWLLRLPAPATGSPPPPGGNPAAPLGPMRS